MPAAALHAAAEALRKRFPAAQVKLRENLGVIVALCRTTRCIPQLAAAIEGMRKACRMASEVLDMLTPQIQPGITTREIDRLAHDYMVKRLLSQK